MSTDLQKSAGGELRVFSGDVDIALVRDALVENVGSGGVSEFDFERIKIPTGGNLGFNVCGPEGPDVAKEIVAVIVLSRDARAYWSEAFDSSGGNLPPDCHSFDGRFGVGEPGGDCEKCPFSQFESAVKYVKGEPVKGRGQACKATRQLFILRGASLLPEVLSLPPTSLKAAKKYMLALAGRGIPYWAAVTKIGLESDKNNDGIQYSKASFTYVGQLTGDERAKAQQYAEMLRPMVSRMATKRTDFD